MAMNLVQFQPGLSMVEFMQHYGTEAKCYRALRRNRVRASYFSFLNGV